jgi:hypothetical protein
MPTLTAKLGGANEEPGRKAKRKKQESSMIPVYIKETRGIKATIALALSTIEETSKKKRR